VIWQLYEAILFENLQAEVRQTVDQETHILW
jgi:hypothetical protein